MRDALGRMKAALRRGGPRAGDGKEAPGDPERARKLAEKNERLASLREQVEKKDRQMEALKAELAQARGERRLPAFAETDVPVFFVVGRGKSGTTWLRNLLNAHPEILCRGEGRFFERHFRRMVPDEDLETGWLKSVQPTSLYAAISSSELLRDWIERSVWTEEGETERHLGNLQRLATNYFLADALSRSSKRIVGDKTTFSDAGILDEVSGLYPEAKVIHVVRDGRDVAVSMIHHMWNLSKDVGGFYRLESEELAKRDAYREGRLPPGEGLFTERRMRNVARSWAEGVGRVAERGPVLLGGNFTEVRYEDLLGDPEEGAARLLSFLGAADNGDIVRSCVEASSFERWSEGRGRGREESSSFYRKGVAGDWKNVFTEADRRVFKEVAGDVLVRLGYETGHDW